MRLRECDEQIDRDAALVDARRAMTEVYSYLLRRCGSVALAEDLTSDAVLAAVDRLLSGHIDRITPAYVVGVARHKLVDHWRRAERERRHLSLQAGAAESEFAGVTFEPSRAEATLARLSPMHRAALTLRYVDDLTVPAVAGLLGRSVASTETLLMRAKRAFRAEYEEMESVDD